MPKMLVNLFKGLSNIPYVGISVETLKGNCRKANLNELETKIMIDKYAKGYKWDAIGIRYSHLYGLTSLKAIHKASLYKMADVNNLDEI